MGVVSAMPSDLRAARQHGIGQTRAAIHATKPQMGDGHITLALCHVSNPTFRWCRHALHQTVRHIHD
jgi:hypothetical protein